LEQAAAFLKSRKKIVLSGMGASYFACLPLQHFLSGSGFDAACKETAELLYFEASSVTEDTAAILVSRSGESIEVTKLLARFEGVGVPVLGVVNVPGSSLALGATHCIEIRSPADQLVAIQTYIATLAVFAMLHAAVIGELDQARVELEQTIEVLEASIPEWVKAREEWYPFLEGNSPLYVLGRGPALAAVSEGVLLMHETAKFPAVGMSVPQFRHGPVEVVDSAFRTIIIGTQPETVDLDSSLADDIIGMGGLACWLGPERPSCKAKSLCSWPAHVPKRFAPIVETIPLQIAAYTKAEIRGLRPGDFRWATAITSSEAGFCTTK